ncbi:MAG: c-type cytochrome [Cyclobacteriaceae bacterium]
MKSKIKNLKSKILNYLWLAACSLQLVACGQSSTKDTKFQQYYVQGEQLYKKNCSNCHQKKGGGLGRVYPPLNISDYMDQHFEEVLCLMKYGKEGEIIVNGRKFNKSMKGITSLTELEIAEIATYIYNTWEHKKGMVEIAQVNEALKKCQE